MKPLTSLGAEYFKEETEWRDRRIENLKKESGRLYKKIDRLERDLANRRPWLVRYMVIRDGWRKTEVDLVFAPTQQTAADRWQECMMFSSRHSTNPILLSIREVKEQVLTLRERGIDGKEIEDKA